MRERGVLWMCRALVLGIMAYSVVKGFALRPHPYALSQYMYTYERGFLVRGLPGELAALACGERFECIARVVDVTSALALAGFVFVLFLVVQTQWRRPYGALLLLALVGSGPLLVSVGAARGYHDALTLGLGLLSYYFCLRRRAALSCIFFFAALLVHELVAIYVLPLFVLPMLTRQPPRRWLGRLALIAAFALATLCVVRAGAANESQRRFLVAKIRRSAPVFSAGWRGYRRFGPVAAKAESTRIRPNRFRTLERANLRPYLLPLAALVCLAVAALLRRVRVLELPVYVTLMVAPLTVHLVAWDYDRLTSLAGVTGAVVCAEVFRRFSGPNTVFWIAGPVALVVAIQLSDPYRMLVKNYARGHTAIRALRQEFEVFRARSLAE